MYTTENVERSTMEYFSGDKLATKVWIEKYALRDPNGNLLELTPKDMHKRLAKEFARIENKYPNPLSEERIMELLENFRYFIPGGSIMFGLGNNYSFSSLGNCFVIGNDADSYGSIFLTDQEQVQLMKRRGGVGHDISHLRPKNSLVSNSARSSTGAVSFMPRFSNSTREVAQDGRRGALMLSIMINHPDVVEFITSKDDLTKITGANISIKITDEFMYCVENNLPYSLIFPTEPIADEALVEVVVDAKTLWQKIIHQAWKSAEPGVLFWDAIIRESPADSYDQFKSKSTNPCGEVPLSPYDSCRLGSMNLYSYVEDPFTDKAKFNYVKFNQDAIDAQRLMDDVVDLEIEKVDKILEKISSDKESEDVKRTEYNLWIKIRKSLVDGRRTGLGMLGLADAGAAMNMRYSSEPFVTFAELVARRLALGSYSSSIQMAEERGCFPIWDWEKENKNPFICRILNDLPLREYENYISHGRRNIANLSIAPTGTLAILAQVSSGIEPVFALFYRRKRKVLNDDPYTSIDATGDKWFEYNVLHPKFKEWLMIQGRGLTTNSEFVKLSIEAMTEEQLNEIVEESPYLDSTANEIYPINKIKMQGRVQKWIDHSISITHNLPSTISEEAVSNIYFEAWKSGCKGVTVYRDGSRDGVLTTKETKTNVVFEQHDAPKRPKELACDVFAINVKNQQFLIVVGLMEGKPYEIFAVKYSGNIAIKHGFVKKVSRGVYNVYDLNKNLVIEDITSNMSQVEESTTRLISWGLRHGAGLSFLVEQLSKVEGNGFQDFSRVIIRVLKKYIKDGTKPTGHTCDNCGSTDLEYRDGCLTCMNCGSSKCG